MKARMDDSKKRYFKKYRKYRREMIRQEKLRKHKQEKEEKLAQLLRMKEEQLQNPKSHLLGFRNNDNATLPVS